MTDSTPSSHVPGPSPSTGRPRESEAVVLRSWPKIIMMWPTLLFSIACTILMSMYEQPAPGAKFNFIHLINLIFLLVLAINLMLLLYDLNLWGFLILVLILAVAVLIVFLIGGSAWQKIGRVLSIRVHANSAFYSLFSIVLIMNLVIAWVITRFNYWKVEHNEIIIHRGFMHEQERHPTAQARFTLVIEDIVEYAILGAGTLVFTFADDGSRHELTTVPMAHRHAKKLDALLGRVAVTER